jgi:predicted Rossmann-fold nucleotide-binding protein
MMGAVAKAARAGGARTVGVIPEVFANDNEFTSPDKDAHELIVCKNMIERKMRMQALSDGFIVLPGGIGQSLHLNSWLSI